MLDDINSGSILKTYDRDNDRSIENTTRMRSKLDDSKHRGDLDDTALSGNMFNKTGTMMAIRDEAAFDNEREMLDIIER